MSTSALEKATIIAEKLKGLPPDEINRISQENVDSSLEEHKEFKSAFARGHCYICDHTVTAIYVIIQLRHLAKSDLVYIGF